jgi:stress-induced morphogen
MPLPANELHAILTDKFPGATIQIDDLADDNDHYRAHITAPQFAGLSRVQMHQMVNRALADTPAAGIHALSLVTKSG